MPFGGGEWGQARYASGDRRRGRGSFGVNLECPIVTNGAFETCSSQITLRTCLNGEFTNLPVSKYTILCRLLNYHTNLQTSNTTNAFSVVWSIPYVPAQ